MTFGYPVRPLQLCLPAPPELLRLPEHCLSTQSNNPPGEPPRKRKARPPKPDPKKFSGKVRLYWQDFGDKDDIIVEIHDPETYAIFEILHGLYELETYEKWQDNPPFSDFHTVLMEKANIYADRLKRLYRLKVDKWDWDWWTYDN